jgi:hypothetical protein
MGHLFGITGMDLSWEAGPGKRIYAVNSVRMWRDRGAWRLGRDVERRWRAR